MTLAFTSECPGISLVLANRIYISQATKSQSNSIPKEQFTAIYDTGATHSVISQEVVNKCQLSPIGMTKVSTAAGEQECETYFVNIILPNRVCFQFVKVTKAPLIGDFNVLIGMDIISKGDFAITNYNGKTVFSYRYPSCERIDFVKQQRSPVTRPSQKIGRNEPCPCGSGKKYKNCCGRLL